MTASIESSSKLLAKILSALSFSFLVMAHFVLRPKFQALYEGLDANSLGVLSRMAISNSVFYALFLIALVLLFKAIMEERSNVPLAKKSYWIVAIYGAVLVGITLFGLYFPLLKLSEDPKPFPHTTQNETKDGIAINEIDVQREPMTLIYDAKITGTPSKGKVGRSTFYPNTQNVIGLKIVEISNNSILEKLGLKVGDIVVAFNGSRIDSQLSAMNLLRDLTNAQDGAQIEILRAKE